MPIGSFNTISIQRLIPVVNGYVQLPLNKEKNKNSVTTDRALAVSGTKLIRSSAGGGASTAGGKHGGQEFIQLPAIHLALGPTVPGDPPPPGLPATIIFPAGTISGFNGGSGPFMLIYVNDINGGENFPLAGYYWSSKGKFGFAVGNDTISIFPVDPHVFTDGATQLVGISGIIDVEFISSSPSPDFTNYQEADGSYTFNGINFIFEPANSLNVDFNTNNGTYGPITVDWPSLILVNLPESGTVDPVYNEIDALQTE